MDQKQELQEVFDLLYQSNLTEAKNMIHEVVCEEVKQQLHEEQLHEFVQDFIQGIQSVSQSIESFIGIPTENIAQGLVSFAVSQSSRVAVASAGLSGASALLIPIAGSVVAGMTFRMLFKQGKQKTLWKDIERLVQRRDMLFDKMKNSNLSKEEAEKAYGDQIEKITNDIREKSSQLYNLITSRKGREGLLRDGLSEEQIKQIEEYVKVGIAGGFSNQRSMNEQALEDINNTILQEQKQTSTDPLFAPVHQLTDQLVDVISQDNKQMMKQYIPYSGSAIGSRPLEFLFKQGKSKELWNKLGTYVQQRDRILRSIRQSDMDKDQIIERYGQRLDTLSSSIRETAQKLFNYLSTSKGKSMFLRNNTTEQDYKKALELVKKGIRGEFSDYLPIVANQ